MDVTVLILVTNLHNFERIVEITEITLNFLSFSQISVKMENLGGSQSAVTGIEIKYSDNIVSLKTGW